MFSRPIVFVVGAGASAEFNLIDGRGLNAQLAKTLNFGRQGSAYPVRESPSYSICCFASDLKIGHLSITRPPQH